MALLVTLAASAASGQQFQKQSVDAHGMNVYETRYYIIHTDLDEIDAREAAVRMTRMAEEYHARTSDFSGTIREKLPFFLFKNPADYYAAGGLAGSGGVFNGKQLMAIAGDHPNANTWHTVQHEGFHQFAAAVIGGRMPPWLNEGLAEYFGEALFTGDGFVSGVVPPMRLRRVHAELSTDKDGGFKSLPDLMTLSQSEWNNKLTYLNYDQAWSIVYFLAHGENGKYQPAFVSFMQMLARNEDWQQAWRISFGSDDGFEQHWRDYWNSLSGNPSINLYVRANVATLTSFLARSIEQKQTFDSFDVYLKAIKSHALKTPDSDWLPPALIDKAAIFAQRIQDQGARYTITASPTQIVCILPDGAKITGRYFYAAGHVGEVDVDVIPAKPKKPTTHP